VELQKGLEKRRKYTIKASICRVKKEIGGIKSQNRKPPFTSIGFESSFNHLRNNLFLIHHKPYGPRTPHYVNRHQKPRTLPPFLILVPPLLVLLQHHLLKTTLHPPTRLSFNFGTHPDEKWPQRSLLFRGRGPGSDSTKQFWRTQRKKKRKRREEWCHAMERWRRA